MAELPHNSADPRRRSVDDSPGGEQIPQWLANRRSRSPSSQIESAQEAEVEFLGLDETSQEAAIPAPQPLPVPGVPFPAVSSPSPSFGTTLERVPTLRRIGPACPPIVIKTTDSEKKNDKLLRRSLFGIIDTASLTGLIVSLAVHSTAVVVLAVLVVSSTSIDRAIVNVFGTLEKESDEGLEIEMGAEIPDPGKDAAPLQLPEVSTVVSEMLSTTQFNEPVLGRVGGASDGEGDGSGDGTGLLLPDVKAPSYAVTKGSFSVWTDPKDPNPGFSYEIVIQVRVPNDLKRYRGSDLSGLVIGTDEYRQPIKLGSRTYPVQDGRVQIRIRVPGADQLVRDTIRVESKILSEKQVIEIVF